MLRGVRNRRGSRWVLGVVLLLLPAVLTLPTSAMAEPGGSLSATPTGPVMRNEALRFTGAVPGPARRTVRLERQVDAQAWTTIRTWRSSASGTVAFTSRIPTGVAEPFTVRYRVVAPAAGTSPSAETPVVERSVVAQRASLDAPLRVRVGSSFQVAGSFYPARAGRPVQLQRSNGTGWSTVATGSTSTSGTVSFTRSITQQGVTKWRLVASRWNGVPPQPTTAGSIRALRTGDVTAPPVPGGTTAVRRGEQTTIGWAAVSATDLAGYHVYRGITASGPWERLTAHPASGTELADSGYETGSFYAVTSVDELGNESGRSTPVQPTDSTDETSPTVPGGLAAEPGENRVDLTWDPVADPDLAFYRVAMAGTPDGPWVPVTDGQVTAPASTVTGLSNGTTYWFSVTSVDEDGNESARSELVSAVPVDRTAPPVPAAPTGTSGDQRVELAWDAVTADDLAGYRVYQSDSAAGPWSQLGNLVTGTTRSVTGLTNESTYHFSVSSVDVEGNESARSPSSAFSPSDDVAPDAPAGLGTTAGDGRLTLAWDPVSDAVGYRVYRALDGTGPWTEVTTDPVADPTFVDDGLQNGTVYWYVVTAVDVAGNESERSDPEIGVPVDQTPPAVPTGVRVTVDDGALVVAWDAVQADDLLGYQLYRSDSADGPWTHVGELTSATETTVGGLDNGTTYWFSVSATDDATNESDRSEPASGVPGDHVAPPAPSQLSGIPYDRRVNLWWPAVETPDLAGYRVYVATGAAGPWTQVGDDLTSIEAWVDDLTNDTTYHFGVSAFDLAGNESHRTVTTMIPFDDEVPDTPTDLTATPGDGQISLSWSAVAAPDLLGYRVLRAASEAGPWTELTTSPQSATSFVDAGLADETEYFYRVTAVDDDGHVSDPAETSATTGDTTAPATPTGLVATPGNRQVSLSWDAVSDPDLAGYRVHLSYYDNTPWIRTTSTLSTTSHTVSDLNNFSPYWFSVSAVDHDGNVSPESVRLRATPVLPAVHEIRPGVASGETNSCQVRPDGTVWCWGTAGSATGHYSGSGDAAGPREIFGAYGSAWSTVSVGSGHNCGISLDARAWCWGYNGTGALGVGSHSYGESSARQVGTANDWADIAAGDGFTCGVRAPGTLWCWGINNWNQLGDGTTTMRYTPVQVGSATDWATVSAGHSSACATRADGAAWCWGNGPLGAGPNGPYQSSTPVQVASSTRFSTVEVGSSRVCGLAQDGGLWCWGGYVGDGTNFYRPTPVQIGTATDWTDLGVGGSATCATRADGSMWCWGVNWYGQVGDGTTSDRPTPTRVGAQSDWTSVGVGSDHACGTRGSQAWCWGEFGDGQLGDGRSDVEPLPVRVGNGSTATGVAVGSGHACGLRADATASCWGYSGYGQLGSGPVSGSKSTGVELTGTWDQLTAGYQHTCGVREGGTAWCWGYNDSGQLGLGTVSGNATLPTQVGADSTWSQLSGGYASTCGVKQDGTAWCWGDNWAGQVGDGTTTDRTTPVQVGTSDQWASISVGVWHTCATREDGTLWCWGYNGAGEVGDGTTVQRTTPVQVGSDADWEQVSAGSWLTCGVRTDGTAWCWGSNYYGQLGNADGTSTNNPRTTPVRVGDEASWHQVSAGSNHACGVRDDGSAWCWGANWESQLGNGADTYSELMSAVPGAGWASVDAGQNVSCGVRVDGTTWCWGTNTLWQTGTATYRASPGLVPFP